MSEESSATDAELVASARRAPEGDTRAYEALLGRHRDAVLANCRYLTRSPDDAEDLAQEVFVKAYFGLSKFEGKSQFKTWVQRIKINQCLSFIEKRSGRRFLQLEESDPAPPPELVDSTTPETSLMDDDAQQRIAAVLDTLPDTLRVPLLMSDMDQLSCQEIAETLGLGLSAVKMRIKRGREAFRSRYAGMSPPARQPAPDLP